MTELDDWARGWIVRLVKDGGAHGPGSRRTINIEDRSFNYSYDSEADLEALHREREGDSASRRAATYEKQYQGATALWIDAVRLQDGSVVEAVRLVQPFKKRLLGKSSPIGPIVDLSGESDT